MKKSLVAAWVEDRRRAWVGNDLADIGGPFAKQARYYHTPFAEPWERSVTIAPGRLEGARAALQERRHG